MISFLLAAVLSLSAQADSDFLAKTQVTVPGPHGDATLLKTVSDLRSVFLRFQPGLDSSSTIVKPLTVTGTASEPVVQVSIRKCVFLVCETVDLEGEADIREVNGACARNYQLSVDLSRSSQALSGIYDRLDVTACYQKADGSDSGTLLLSASANEAAKYEAGIVQKEIFKMLLLQVAPITAALDQTMRANNTP